jgi:4-coumarate--CoA ligase
VKGVFASAALELHTHHAAIMITASQDMTDGPWSVPESMSLPEFMTQLNPDDVPVDKITNIDTLTGKSLTYGGLRTQAGQVAYSLRHDYAVQVQDTLMIVAPNCTDFVLFAHAIWWAGAAYASINPNSTTQDLAHAIQLVEPTMLFVYPAYLASVEDAIAQTGLDIRLITIVDRVEVLPLFPDDMASEQSLPVLSLEKYGLTGKTARSWIAFSSGTTGRSKGVAHSHYSLIFNAVKLRTNLSEAHSSRAREVFVPLLSHAFGVIFVMTSGAWLGNFNCLVHKFDLQEYCRLSEKYQATWAHVEPSIVIALANSDLVNKYSLKSLKRMVTAGAPIGLEMVKRIRARIGQDCRIIHAYGLTECPGVTVTADSNGYDELGSVGRPYIGSEVRLVDPATGKDANPGELWVKSDSVMMGYIKDDAVKLSAMSEDRQWVKSGDLLRRDENGLLWIVDRIKDLIKYHGLQVPPSELEDVIRGHDAVADVAVGRAYDGLQGTEIPVAFVSLKGKVAELADGSVEKQTLLKEIREFADAQLADHKQLRGGVFHLQELPKSAVGKTLRRLLPVHLGSVQPSASPFMLADADISLASTAT